MLKMQWIRGGIASFAIAAVGGLVAMTIEGEEAKQPPVPSETVAQGSKVKSFMRKKLPASEQILEGLTVPDPTLVRKGATAMIHMSKAAMWTHHGSPSYAQDSADFVRTAERMIRLSNEGDLEGAVHTYAQLTIQCVSCHERVRSQKVAGLAPPNLGEHADRG